MTDFVLDAAVFETERVLADRRHFELAPKQWARFVEILDRPPHENPLHLLMLMKDVRAYLKRGG